MHLLTSGIIHSLFKDRLSTVLYENGVYEFKIRYGSLWYCPSESVSKDRLLRVRNLSNASCRRKFISLYQQLAINTFVKSTGSFSHWQVTNDDNDLFNVLHSTSVVLKENQFCEAEITEYVEVLVDPEEPALFLELFSATNFKSDTYYFPKRKLICSEIKDVNPNIIRDVILLLNMLVSSVSL